MKHLDNDKEERLNREALNYHAKQPPGKLAITTTKATASQRDLSLAYSPGVAAPCQEIFKDKQQAYTYTAKGNLVAVISDGSAVLGLGNIGPEASKPVMEGKAVLFKIFADIDVFDIELKVESIEEFVSVVKALEPTFGGINLEDIKSPACFEIEQRLKKELSIPVMHDDQHGTAIISGAALLNALELQKKQISDAKIVILGAGAAAISCARLYLLLGAKKSNIVMVDSKGVIRKDRKELDPLKAEFAVQGEAHTLEDAMQRADVFIGLSKANALAPETLKFMAPNAIVFAMANPDPEVPYEKALEVRPDIIMATGRSDYPNQVNNVLGFPFIFRGALDVRATTINEEMKLAAVSALATLAKLSVPDLVLQAYNVRHMSFGKDYIIPKPLDPRLIGYVAPAVAKAAMDSGVAQKPIEDWQAYREFLNNRLDLEPQLVRSLSMRAKTQPKSIVFTEANNYKILKAAKILAEGGIARPILLGDPREVEKISRDFAIGLSGMDIIDPRKEERLLKDFSVALYEKRQRKGLSLAKARDLIEYNYDYFAASLLKNNVADVVITGLQKHYKDAILPYLSVIGAKSPSHLLSGIYILSTKKEPLFLADASINLDPTAEQLVDITLLAHEFITSLGITPRIALLSHSNFGSNKNSHSHKVAKAVELLHVNYPDLLVDGEMQASFALNNASLEENFGFSRLVGSKANAVILPNLDAANIALNLVKEIARVDSIGPILTGMNKPVHVLQLGCSIREIVHLSTVAVVNAHTS